MPIRYADYSPEWPTIRARILERATRFGVPRCERCGVAHHAVGYRDAEGTFVPNCGNLHCDASGEGMNYDTGDPLTYAAAKFISDTCNCCGNGKRKTDDGGNRWIVVVLTIGHIDHDVSNNSDNNLRAWCSRCHFRHDAKYHAINASATRARKRNERREAAGVIALSI